MKFSVITSNYNQVDNLKMLLPYWLRQTWSDFEWIIADDGSTDTSVKWCNEHGVKIAGKLTHKGYGLTESLNKAAKVAKGDYLVFVMGDSIPKSDFLAQMLKGIETAPNKALYCGLRYDIDWETREVVRPEWRASMYPQFPWFQADAFGLQGDEAYKLMTLNTMCMEKADFEAMGGIPLEYDAYGKMDWYMAAWSHFAKHRLTTIVPRAIVYHRLHDDRPDSDHNTEVFEKHLMELKKHG